MKVTFYKTVESIQRWLRPLHWTDVAWLVGTTRPAALLAFIFNMHFEVFERQLDAFGC